MYIKDLRVFVSPPGDVERRPRRKRRKRRHHEPHDSRTLADIVLVEDCVFAGAGQPDNIVPISHWMGDRSDTALSALASLLMPEEMTEISDKYNKPQLTFKNKDRKRNQTKRRGNE